MKKENKKGESWRKGYQQGISDYNKELKREIEKFKIPYDINGTFVREGGYNQAIQDILNLLHP